MAEEREILKRKLFLDINDGPSTKKKVENELEDKGLRGLLK